MKTFIFSFLMLTGIVALAQIPKPLKHTYVNDFAHVLTDDQIKNLNKQIFEIEKGAGVQLAIVLVNKIPAQYEIQDYSLLIGRKWHVGNHKKGLVYVAAIKQHKQRLEVARNLDGVLDNEKSTAILTAMKGDYAAGNYYSGLQTLVVRLTGELVAPPVVEQTVVPQIQKTVSAEDHSNDTFYLILGIAFIIGVPVLLIMLLARRRRATNIQYNTPNYNGGIQPGYGVGYGQGTGSSVGSFATGAIVGAAAGYAARTIQDHIANDHYNNTHYIPTGDNYASTPSVNNDSDNNSSNWGNWGSDDSSSSNSSSSYDSGFSDSDSSSDSGATTDW